MKTILSVFVGILFSVSAIAQSSESFLVWDASPAIEQVTQYRVYERTGENNDWTYTLRINVTEPSVAVANLPGLSAGSRTYVVTAVNIYGESGYSLPITIPVSPTPPQNVRLQVIVIPKQ